MIEQKKNGVNTGKQHQTEEGNQKNKAFSRWFLPVVIIILVGLSGYFLLKGDNLESEPSSQATNRAIGPESATVMITEYGDFSCIACKAWHQSGIREEVIEKYGDQVRFVWHDFPVISPVSPKAAEAGFCANDQGQFWDYHDILFENSPALGVDNLIIYAKEIGLDGEEFAECLNNSKYKTSVEVDLKAATDLGFTSVPSFIINGRRMIGPPSFEQLSSIIDSLLQPAN